MRSLRREPFFPCLLCALFVSFAFPAVEAAAADDTDGVAYFETHIRPLLAAHCYECHSHRTKRSEGGLTLDSRAGWTKGGHGGPAMIAGDADASLLIQAVRYENPELEMPPDQPLPPEAIARLEHWVRIGAPDPRDRPATSTVAAALDPEAGRDHWSFRPLEDPATPIGDAADWPRSSIDHFILDRLETAGLKPAPDADPRDLVRRVYVQLIGLPPTHEQIQSFLDDSRPDAYVRLVDQLLGSHHFAQRWGRHWLDLARYADSNGLDENFLFREAWRYRNWVIDAINADTPFDQFLLQQIAGDLLPYDSIEQRDRQRIAAGFLVIGPKVLLGNDPKKQAMEVADEQLDTIGRAILGQSLGCARCHDHKFDPFPTADYYALAGILTSTKVVERRYMLGQQRVMERLVGLGPDGDQLNQQYEKYWRELPAIKQRRKHAGQALQALEQEDPEAWNKLVAGHADSIAEGAADTTIDTQRRIEAQQKLIAQLDQVISKPVAIPPRAMNPVDVEAPADEHIRLAGQFDRLGDQVPRGFLTALAGAPAEIDPDASGRVELSRWLTDVDDGAGALTARVLANRIWHHLIGCGLVRTVDNFGNSGEAPSHPELLDHLASRLIDSDWSIKDLVRSIVLSRTFTISSRHDDSGHAVDPDNRLLWRAHRRRLGPETLRDAMRLAADQLDLTPMQSSVWYLGDQATAVGDNKNRRRTDFPCRSVYLPVIRNDLPELFDVFGFADPHATTGARSETTVPTQGLFMLNSESVMDAADATARRVLCDGETNTTPMKITRMFRLILGTDPSDQQQRQMLSFLSQAQQHLSESGHSDVQLRCWSLACHALFASSHFQILE